MEKLLPKTIKGWCAKKRLFMRLWIKEPSPEQAEVYEQAINYCDRKVGQVHKARLHFFTTFLLCLCLFLGGCKAGIGLGVDGSLYYPNIPNKLEDPAESREQSTQHTTGMARNNLPMIGGAK